MIKCRPVSETKQCKRCNKILPIDDFEIATKAGHRRGECRTCGSIIEFINRKPGRTEDDYWKWKDEVKETEKLFNEGKRKCGCCGEIKLLSEYNKGVLKGYQSQCRVCTRAKFKSWYKKNNPEVKERDGKNRHNRRTPEQKEKYLAEKAYKEELHSLQKEGKRRCRYCREILPLEKFSNCKKGHHGRKSYCNPCAMEKWQKPYRAKPENRLKKSGYDKKYRSKPGVKQRINKQLNERYHNDPAYKLKMLMRGRINKVLDRKKQSKRFTQELGCTFDELVVHLESQFYPDPKTGEVMSWDNHTTDGWHVDHIRPLHEFDLYDDEQFKEAAHYTNLRPLWWWQNLERNRGHYYG